MHLYSPVFIMQGAAEGFLVAEVYAGADDDIAVTTGHLRHFCQISLDNGIFAHHCVFE